MAVHTLEKAKQHWQSAADIMPQLICLLNGKGQLIRTNRTVERWGLGRVDDVRGLHLHAILHPDCAGGGRTSCARYETRWTHT